MDFYYCRCKNFPYVEKNYFYYFVFFFLSRLKVDYIHILDIIRFSLKIEEERFNPWFSISRYD